MATTARTVVMAQMQATGMQATQTEATAMLMEDTTRGVSMTSTTAAATSTTTKVKDEDATTPKKILRPSVILP